LNQSIDKKKGVEKKRYNLVELRNHVHRHKHRHKVVESTIELEKPH